MSKLENAARGGEDEVLTDLWLEALEDSPPYEEFFRVLSLLLEEDRTDTARSLMEVTVEEKEMQGGEDFNRFLIGSADLFHHSEILRKALVEYARDEYLMFQPLEQFLRLSGLKKKNADIAEVWPAFLSLMKFSEGACIYHPNFGVGRIIKVSRAHMIIDFQNKPGHDMKLDVVLGAALVLPENSILAMATDDPGKFGDLLKNEPQVFLKMIVEEPFGEAGEIRRDDLTPFGQASGLDREDIWKALRKAALSTNGFVLMSDRIARLDEGVGPYQQLVKVLAKKRISVSEKVSRVTALLKSCSRSLPRDLSDLLDPVLEISSPETGSLFELAWLLTSRGREDRFNSAAEQFIETGAARAERAIGEIHSTSCRKDYVRLFFTGGPDREDKKRLLGVLRRSLWEYAMTCIDETDPELLEECVQMFLSDPSSTDRFLWTLMFLAEEGAGEAESGDASSEEGEDSRIGLFLDNLMYASADTQRKVIRMLKDSLRSEFDRYCESLDTRKLGNYLDSYSSSATAHNEGLVLLISRELSRRKSSGTGRTSKKHFWDSPFMFSSSSAIAEREREVEQLRQTEIPAAADAIGEAASHGDLSENAEYAAAIEKRDLLLARLHRWSDELQKYRPYPADQINTRVVSPGVSVTIQDTGESEEVRVFQVVGPLDADPDSGRINYLAPLGVVLLGKSAGDLVDLPDSSSSEWRIVSIDVLRIVDE